MNAPRIERRELDESVAKMVAYALIGDKPSLQSSKESQPIIRRKIDINGNELHDFQGQMGIQVYFTSTEHTGTTNYRLFIGYYDLHTMSNENSFISTLGLFREVDPRSGYSQVELLQNIVEVTALLIKHRIWEANN